MRRALRLALAGVLLQQAVPSAVLAQAVRASAVPPTPSLALPAPAAVPGAQPLAPASSLPPALTGLSGLAGALPVSPEAAEGGLRALYEGAGPGLAAMTPVPAVGEARPALADGEPIPPDDGEGLRGRDGGGPSPAPEGPRELLEKAKRRFFAVPVEARVVAGVVLAALLIVWGLHHHAANADRFWSGSKSAAEVRLVDAARQSRQPAVLEKVAQEAEARHDRMAKRVADAEVAKQKRVDDKTKDTRKQAKALAAFDHLVSARARLNHNAVSEDPDKRIGERTLLSWKETVALEESYAKGEGHEGRLALKLKGLREELGRQNGKAGDLGGRIERFGEHVPTLFNGTMGVELEKGRKDLAEFKDTEVSPEQALLNTATSAQRGRVDVRLYGESPEYKGHRDRRDRLSILFDRKAQPALSTARQVETDLKEMISNRQTEAAMLVLAEANRRVAVTKTKYWTDSEGRRHSKDYTVYEDHSGTYRLLAAAAAEAARGNAREANRGLERLRPQVAALSGDATLRGEGLAGALPAGAGAGVREGPGGLGDVFFPPLFSLFTGLSSESSGQKALREFRPVVSSIESVAGQVASRRDGEIRWVESGITADLDRQMKEATW